MTWFSERSSRIRATGLPIGVGSLIVVESFDKAIVCRDEALHNVKQRFGIAERREHHHYTAEERVVLTNVQNVRI